MSRGNLPKLEPWVASFNSLGENLGQGAAELVSLEPIEAEFYLPERDASRVSLGDRRPTALTRSSHKDELSFHLTEGS